jgi:hypothetical protein
MQPSTPLPPSNGIDFAEHEVRLAGEQIAATEAVICSLQTAGVTTLRQKLELKKAEEQLFELRKVQEVSTNPRALPASSAKRTCSQASNDALLCAKNDERAKSAVTSSAASLASPAVVTDTQAPSQEHNPKLLATRIRAISSFQTLFKRASATDEEVKVTSDRELAKVRTCILKTRGFSALDDQQVDRLLASGKRRVFEEEQRLIRQGDFDVGYFFVLIEGSMKYVVDHDSETSKSGLISCSDHGNLVGHFGSLYRRVRDSSVYSVPGAVAWQFSFQGVPGQPFCPLCIQCCSRT